MLTPWEDGWWRAGLGLAMWISIGLFSSLVTAHVLKQWKTFDWQLLRWDVNANSEFPFQDNPPRSVMAWPSVAPEGWPPTNVASVGSGVGWMAICHRESPRGWGRRFGRYRGLTLSTGLPARCATWTGVYIHYDRLSAANPEFARLARGFRVTPVALGLNALFHGILLSLIWTLIKSGVRRARRRGLVGRVCDVVASLCGGVAISMGFVLYGALGVHAMTECSETHWIRSALDPDTIHSKDVNQDSKDWLTEMPTWIDREPFTQGWKHATFVERISQSGVDLNPHRTAVSNDVLVQHRFGWPARSAHRFTMQDDPWSNDYFDSGSQISTRQPSFSNLDGLRGGYTIPEVAWLPSGTIPLLPIWHGLVINTLVFGGMLWLGLGAISEGRRWQRGRMGQCPRCGYEITNILTCPECGASREAEGRL